MSPPAIGLHKLAAPAGFEPTLLGSEPSTLANYVKEHQTCSDHFVLGVLTT